jgi:hypothetical protein
MTTQKTEKLCSMCKIIPAKTYCRACKKKWKINYKQTNGDKLKLYHQNYYNNHKEVYINKYIPNYAVNKKNLPIVEQSIQEPSVMVLTV